MQMCNNANALELLMTSKLLSLDDDGPLYRGNSLSSTVEGLQEGDSLFTLFVGIEVKESFFTCSGYVVGLL